MKNFMQYDVYIVKDVVRSIRQMSLHDHPEHVSQSRAFCPTLVKSCFVVVPSVVLI
jgi:hypothetical protein